MKPTPDEFDEDAVYNEDSDEYTFVQSLNLSKRPDRVKIINEDDIINLKIALGTLDTVEAVNSL